MTIHETPITAALDFLKQSPEMDAWVIYDYRNSNPIFWAFMNKLMPSLSPENITRPVFLVLPREEPPWVLTHEVDAGGFALSPLTINKFSSRQDMIETLAFRLKHFRSVFMEYSPNAALPRVSRVDAGTIELIRSLKIQVHSSADILQYATQRWDNTQLASHLKAASDLTRIVREAFQWIGMHTPGSINEYQVHKFIQAKYKDNNLETDEGPIVAVNDHGSDPHFLPTPENSYLIHKGDWILIDLWAKEQTRNSIYADITWTGVYASSPTDEQTRVFTKVIEARDTATTFMNTQLKNGKSVAGWQVDQIARNHINASGYGSYFTHRLGHSLGSEVHSEAVNLDNWETQDNRLLIPRLGVTIEPGIYLPHFGVRSEINAFIMEQGEGVQITTPPQAAPFTIL